MSRFSKVTILTACLWFLVAATLPLHAQVPSGSFFSTLLTLALLLFGFVSTALVPARWRKERWLSIVPTTSCALAVLLAPEVRVPLENLMFTRSFPHYESIIRQMESGSIAVSADLRRIPQAERFPTYRVLAQQTNGVLSVEFLTGSGFPVKHSGYLYCSSGTIERGSLMDSRWPKRVEVKPFWFRVSD